MTKQHLNNTGHSLPAQLLRAYRLQVSDLQANMSVIQANLSTIIQA